MRVEYGDHCFGSFLTIDNKEVSDMSREEKRKIVRKFMDNDLLLYEMIKVAVEYAEGEEKYSSNSCDQCGNYNFETKKVIEL